MYNLDMGLRGELGVQDGDQAIIQFDGDHAAGLRGQSAGEDAEARADFEHNVVRRQVGGGDDVIQMLFVDQKVLAERLFGVEVVGAD
jgi:hypothetical protein